jgi:hypothetical protein
MIDLGEALQIAGSPGLREQHLHMYIISETRRGLLQLSCAYLEALGLIGTRG